MEDDGFGSYVLPALFKVRLDRYQHGMNVPSRQEMCDT